MTDWFLIVIVIILVISVGFFPIIAIARFIKIRRYLSKDFCYSPANAMKLNRIKVLDIFLWIAFTLLGFSGKFLGFSSIFSPEQFLIIGILNIGYIILIRGPYKFWLSDTIIVYDSSGFVIFAGADAGEFKREYIQWDNISELTVNTIPFNSERKKIELKTRDGSTYRFRANREITSLIENKKFSNNKALIPSV